jgi:hypothetical protein
MTPAWSLYGKAAERFSDALAACIQKIQESLTRFRQIAPNIRTCRVEKFPFQLLFTLKEDRIYIIAVSMTGGLRIIGGTGYHKNR